MIEYIYGKIEVIILDSLLLNVITCTIISVVVITIVLIVFKKRRIKAYYKEIEYLDKEKNLIESAPILIELQKVETIIKNEKMEEKYKNWQDRFQNIKNDNISKLNDMIIELDMLLNKKDYKNYIISEAKAELELYKAREATDTLLHEIEDINESEEKYRTLITKLKSKYRELSNKFEKDKDSYEEVAEIIELQFENIEKRFQDFESFMEKNEYSEVVHIVKAVDAMIDHMEIVIKEVPDLLLLATKLIPKRIEQINEIYDEMTENNFPLDYLNIEYNVEESLKNVNKILDRIKVLNLEDCMFELKTMLDYLDSLFKEFEDEKIARHNFEEEKVNFEEKFQKVSSVVDDIYGQVEDIKNMYDLTDRDITIIDEVNIRLKDLTREYKLSLTALKKKRKPYSTLNKDLKTFSNNLKLIEEDLDVALKSLGNMYDDELRAREQLDEIQELLKQSRTKIRSYKLPFINNNYFVQLSEANDAIGEIIKELEKKPIVIKVLNTRVDTARDLALKVFNATNEMVQTASTVEKLIVYGNKYRVMNSGINDNLNYATELFHKGNYDGALEVVLQTLETVEPGIRKSVIKYAK